MGSCAVAASLGCSAAGILRTRRTRGFNRDGDSRLLQGMSACSAGVALGCSAAGVLRTRRTRSASTASTNAAERAGMVTCPTSASGREGDQGVAVGDFCPLYSDVTLVSFSTPLRTGGYGRSGHRWRARSAANSENGMFVGPAQVYTAEEVLPRIGKVSRVTKETSVDVHINLDGTGICSCDTGIPFLDHMLDQLASHGLVDVKVMAKGDVHIDDHHSNEDIGLAVGTALLQALGDRRGIHRFGDFTAPLDEALVSVVLDLSGRPYLGYDLNIPTQRVGTYDTQLVEHFFQSLVNTSGMTLHIRQLAGKNSHHIIEATFKAFARALRQAVEHDVRRRGTIPSSKGVLSRA